MASNNFGVPSELDDDALDKALTEAQSKGAELAKIKDEEFSDDNLAEFEAVVDFITSAKAEKETRAAAAAERAQKIESLRSTVVVEKEDDEDEEVVEVVEAPTEEEEEDDEKKTRPFASETETAADEAGSGEAETATGETESAAKQDEDTSTNEASAEGEGEDEAPAESTEKQDNIPSNEDTNEEKEQAEVGNTKPSLADAAKSNIPDVPDTVEESNFSLVASANVPGIPAGKEYGSLAEAAEAILASAKALPTSGRSHTKLPALTFKDGSKLAQDATGNDTELLMKAGNESRLEGQSLVAAGGWMAPSEQLLDFCSIESAEGLYDLPSITVNRGGVNYTKGPNFETVLNSDTGFWDMTEAVAEAGTELKTSLRPAAPDFVDVRLEAVGVMVEAGLLTRHAWPELVERYAQLAVLAHQVKVHHKLIGKVTEYVGDAVAIDGGYGNALDILNVLDVVIAGERQRYSLGQSTTMETLLPVWLKSAIRTDLANRTGVDLLDVTDARINAWFAQRGARVQWLQHWQNLERNAAGIVTSYPDTVEVITYPAGTYVKGGDEIITLNTVYDSVNLKRNDYVHLFMEQSILVANPCHEGRRVTVPLRINGRTAAADIARDFGTAAAAPGTP